MIHPLRSIFGDRMDPQAYEQVFQLFEDSLEREAGERTDFIRTSCEDTTIAVEAIKLV